MIVSIIVAADCLQKKKTTAAVRQVSQAPCVQAFFAPFSRRPVRAACASRSYTSVLYCGPGPLSRWCSPVACPVKTPWHLFFGPLGASKLSWSSVLCDSCDPLKEREKRVLNAIGARKHEAIVPAYVMEWGEEWRPSNCCKWLGENVCQSIQSYGLIFRMLWFAALPTHSPKKGREASSAPLTQVNMKNGKII